MIEAFEVFVKHGDGSLSRLGWAECCEGVWVGFRPDDSHPDGPLSLALALQVDGEGVLGLGVRRSILEVAREIGIPDELTPERRLELDILTGRGYGEGD